ncbi:MAG: hypothetical protein VX768_14485 [Planctomycetota bacterium]|nr:hypothetical protein [Planctomycetota bacterium]
MNVPRGLQRLGELAGRGKSNRPLQSLAGSTGGSLLETMGQGGAGGVQVYLPT